MQGSPRSTYVYLKLFPATHSLRFKATMRLARELVTWQLCSLRSPHAGRAIFSAPSHAYTSQSSVRGAATAKRKQVTVVNDDGRVTWGDLSAREKAARTTQKTFHLGIVLTGLVMTVGTAKAHSDFFTDLKREVLHICFIPRSSLLIVGPASSTVPLMRSGPVREL